LLAVLPSHSQIDSSLGFFALHVGDVRQYHHHYYIYCYNQNYSSHYVERVIGDTVLATGFRYKILESNQPQRYLRLDTSTANVYQYSGYPLPHDDLIDSLRATVGSTFWRSNSGLQIQCIRIDTATILGRRTIAKRFNAFLTGGGWSYSLAYGFGLVNNVSSYEDPCYPVWNFYVTDLSYARINTQEYGTFVGVKNQGQAVPSSFALRQNYPNPFNPSTTISYELPRPSTVTLCVYNVAGQVVATLVDAKELTGFHEVMFRADRLATGVYLYRLRAGDFTATRKMLVLQ
jgi:hypothetical protein